MALPSLFSNIGSAFNARSLITPPAKGPAPQSNWLIDQIRKITPLSSTTGFQSGGMGATGGQTGGGGYSGGGGVDQGTAQQSAEAENLRSEIISRRDRANAIFDALTGAVSALAKAKRSELESQFTNEQQTATQDYSNQGEQLNRVYAARGLGDSSYRVNALDQAAQAFQAALSQLGQEKQSGLAEIGAQAQGQLGAIQADRGSIEDLRLGELGDDVGSLRELRNSLDDRIRQAEVQQGTLNTPEGFRGRLAKIAPSGGASNALKAALDSLVNSATPKKVKDTLAQSIIANYDPDNGQFWKNYYDTEAQKTQTATAVG